MPVLDLPPSFVNNVGLPLSATYLNALRTAAIQLDAWSYRHMPAFDSSAGLDTKTPGYYPSAPPFRIWRGYFKWRTGMTTLTIIGRTASAPAGATLKTYVNDNPVAADTIASPLPSTFTRTISISSGYTDGQIVAVELKIEGSGTTTAMEVVILDIYADPIVYSSSWPGTPTFAGTYDSGRLNQLINACTWLYERMNTTPMVPNRAQAYALGPFADPAARTYEGHYPLYYGSIQRSYTDSYVRIIGTFTNVTSTSIRYRVYLGGSLAFTSSTYGPGTYTIYEKIALSNTVGTRTELSIFAEVIDAGPNNPPSAPWRQSRWSPLLIREEASTSYPYATPPTAFAQGSLSVATLNSRLNAISTMLANTKTRIDADTHVWGRARAVRRWYGLNEVTSGNLDKRAPIIFERRGDRVIVAGKGVTIGFGAFQLPSDPSKVADDYTFSQTAEAVPADKVQTKTIWLDSIPSLEYGLAYYIQGEGALYAEELMSP